MSELTEVQDSEWARNAVVKFAALADHLGCDPAELEGMSLVEWYEAIDETLNVLIGGDPEDELRARQMLRKALAPLPEPK